MSKSSSGSSSSRSPDTGPPRTPTRGRRFSSSSTGRAPALQTISETRLAGPPPIPAKSNLRNGSDLNLPQTTAPTHQSPLRTWFDNRASTDTRRTAPPAYEWVSAPGPEDTQYLDNGPVEGEKLAALRQAGGFRRDRKGRWLWMGLLALAALIVIGLAVGLGVGLTVGRHNSNDDASSAPATAGNNTQNQTFPLGQYNVVTALRTVDTSCTSISATWRCYPYATYNPSDANTASASRAGFNWMITNTSMHYATNMTGTTPNEGIPANLSISASSNPFGITFSATNLTYISTAGNSSSPRYTFSYTSPKFVFPDPQSNVTTDPNRIGCFFNQTVLTGTLYLAAQLTFPNANSTNSMNNTSSNITAANDFTQWPYAVEFSQASPGGADIPACYEYINGEVGTRLTEFVTPLTAGNSQCLCDYRNYF